jgi:hypothetical protein
VVAISRQLRLGKVSDMQETLEFVPSFPNGTAQKAGTSVALSPGLAALSAPDGDTGAIDLYFYEANKNDWSSVGILDAASLKIKGSVGAFGSSCAAFRMQVPSQDVNSSPGSTIPIDAIVVGASGDASTPGRVFILYPPYGAWSNGTIPIVREILNQNPSDGDQYGASVAHCLAAGVDYLIIGAPGADQAVVFAFDGATGVWVNPFVISDPDSGAGGNINRFGAVVAIDTVVNTPADIAPTETLIVAITAPGAGNPNGGIGTVWVGGTIQQGTWPDNPAKLPLSELERSFGPEGEGLPILKPGGFGSSLAFTGGQLLAVGSPNDTTPSDSAKGENSGLVWIFNLADLPMCDPNLTISSPTTHVGEFGSSVAFPVTGPGDIANHLLVGEPGGGTNGTGVAYRFVNSDSTATGLWNLSDTFTNSDAESGDGFGSAVAASPYDKVGGNYTGNCYLVSAPENPVGTETGRGYLYAFPALATPAPTEQPSAGASVTGSVNPIIKLAEWIRSLASRAFHNPFG